MYYRAGVQLRAMLIQADLPSFALDGETYVRPDFAGRGLANLAPTLVRLLAPAAALVSIPARLRRNGRAVFPPFLSIYRTMKPSRQGRSDRRPGHLISC